MNRGEKSAPAAEAGAKGDRVAAGNSIDVSLRHSAREVKPAGVGWSKVPWALREVKLAKMSGAAAKVYLALATHADIDTHEATPSVHALAVETGQHRGTAWRALRELARLQAIEPTADGWRLLDVAPTRPDVAPTRRAMSRPRDDSLTRSLFERDPQTTPPPPSPPSKKRRGANGRSRRYRYNPDYSAAQDVKDFNRHNAAVREKIRRNMADAQARAGERTNDG